MHYTNLKPGDVLPLDGTRKPFGAPCDAAWFVVTTLRQRRGMVAAAAWLTKVGALDAWFPEDSGKRVVRRGHRKVREEYERPVVPGIVFMLADAWPQWDVLAQRHIRPMKIGEKPVAVTEAIMAQMVRVPNRIAELRAAVEAAERAEREARAPRPGRDAVFVSGPFTGRVVHVKAVTGGWALVVVDGLKIRASVTGLEHRA